ncbi:MAG: Yip1 family protein [Chloroflexota bacterium]
MPIDRMIRAARLDPSLYEEVERDLSATTQALLVVVVVSFIAALGSSVPFLGRPGQVMSMLVFGVLGAVVGWVIWSLVTYWIGTSLFRGTATPGELLRTLGFAYTPNILGFFGFIPCFGGLIGLVGAIWSLIAGIVAVRQALDFDTGKAVITVIVGWFALLLISIVLSLFGLGFLGVRP